MPRGNETGQADGDKDLERLYVTVTDLHESANNLKKTLCVRLDEIFGAEVEEASTEVMKSEVEPNAGGIVGSIKRKLEYTAAQLRTISVAIQRL